MYKVVFIICLCIAQICPGQVSIWISGGINYGNVDDRYFQAFDPYHPMYSFKGGIDVSWNMNKKYVLRSGIYNSQRGGSIESPLVEGLFKIVWVTAEMPIIVMRNVTNNLSVGAGIINSYYLSYGERLYEDKKYNVDITGLISWKVIPRLSIEGSYLFGGINTLISKRESYMFSVGNISIAYRLFEFK